MTERNENWQGMNWVRQTTRLALYLRDGMACAYCGDSVENGAQLTLDHVRPVSNGGTNKTGNLVTCCHRCNSSRGNRSVVVFAKAVAEYLDHSVNASTIVSHVRKCVRRNMSEYRAQARKLIASRGSVAKVLADKLSP